MPHKDPIARAAYVREYNARPVVAARLRKQATQRARTYRAEGRHLKHKRAFRERMRALIDAARAVPCMDCGNPFPVVCMDFDHRPNEMKLFEIARWNDHSIEAVIAEIAKCDVVCACCHRVRTVERMGQSGKRAPHWTGA